jgi:hypothetical protein
LISFDFFGGDEGRRTPSLALRGTDVLSAQNHQTIRRIGSRLDRRIFLALSHCQARALHIAMPLRRA